MSIPAFGGAADAFSDFQKVLFEQKLKEEDDSRRFEQQIKVANIAADRDDRRLGNALKKQSEAEKLDAFTKQLPFLTEEQAETKMDALGLDAGTREIYRGARQAGLQIEGIKRRDATRSTRRLNQAARDKKWGEIASSNLPGWQESKAKIQTLPKGQRRGALDTLHQEALSFASQQERDREELDDRFKRDSILTNQDFRATTVAQGATRIEQSGQNALVGDAQSQLAQANREISDLRRQRANLILEEDRAPVDSKIEETIGRRDQLENQIERIRQGGTGSPRFGDRSSEVLIGLAVDLFSEKPPKTEEEVRRALAAQPSDVVDTIITQAKAEAGIDF